MNTMHRIWGELISLDLKTRTGKFRKGGADEVMSFVVLPYAEVYHYSASGDLQEFRMGVRGFFRLHQNDAGEWVWLTYIQDQTTLMNNHQACFEVNSIDAEHGTLVCTEVRFDKTWIRGVTVPIETDGDTHFWKRVSPPNSRIFR